MKKNKVLASTLALAILANTALPATKIAKNININNIAYASENPADINEAKEKLDYLGDLITSIENIAGGLAGNQLSWLKELKHAYELLSKIVNKGIGSASELRNRLIPRIDLLINVAETITADATELADSQQEAHVIVGFSVTRALLKATDLFENADGLNKASANLNEALDRARKVPKLTDESKRTHYTLEQLDRAIARAKEIRNKELRNKLDPTELAEVDIVIRKAIDVRRDNTATVGLVKSMTNELNEKIDQAFKSIPEGERTANKKAKQGLEKDIQAAKNLRDFKLKGKVDSVVIKELNREIAIANRVLNNSRATVNEVINADEVINAAYNKAAGFLKVEVPEEIPEEVEEKPAIDEIIEEQTDELFESDSELETTTEEETVEEIEEFVELEEIDE